MSTFNVENYDSWKPQDFPEGVCCPVGGNSFEYHTGGWRSMRPVWNPEKCKHCMICWMYCPDSCIQTEGGKMLGIGYDHCKGCGVCVTECPFAALELIPEAQAKEGDND